MKIFLLVFLTIVSFFSVKAHAGILFEPYAAYHAMGNYNPQTGSTAEMKLSGLGYGAKLGYSLAIPYFGFEYEGHNYTLTPKNGSTSSTFKSDGTMLGGFLGAHFPGTSISLVGTYYFSDERVYRVSNSSAGDQGLKGSSYKVGLHYNLAHWILLGVDYYNHTYTDYKLVNVSGSSYTALTRKVLVDSIAVVAGLSIP